MSITFTTRAVPADLGEPIIAARAITAEAEKRPGREGAWWKFRMDDDDVFVAPADLSDVKETLKKATERLLIIRRMETLLNGPVALPRL